ncbi:class I tRNA ligase family protein, partial [Paraglaciecola sp.]
RQLWWGHRIPAWYDQSGAVYVGSSEESVRQEHNLSDSIVLQQDDDVLDTWFSSALWTFSTLGWPDENEDLKHFHPASVLVTGFDIIFFWVARMIMMSLHFVDEVPFHTVYVHGLVRDGEGQKMSKSKGNVIDPIDLIDGISLEALVTKRTSGMMQPQLAEKVAKSTRKHFPDGIPGYGTDALRFTFYSLASTGRDIKFDMNRMEGYRNFCNKLWNATRYVLMNCEGKDCGLDNSGKLSLADRWIISRLQQTAADTQAAIDSYRFDHAAQTLYDFVWNEYCDWYLELSKPVLWDDNADETILKGTRQTLIQVLECTLRLLHPLMPFITEEIWQTVAPIAGRSGKTIMLAPWPMPDESQVDAEAEAEIEWLKSLIVAARTIRSESNLPPGSALTVLLRNATTDDVARVERNAHLLRKLAKLNEVRILTANEEAPPSLSALCGHMEVLVPMAGVIDFDAELGRIDKEVARQSQDIKRLEGKLGNASFVDRAPTAVDKEKAKLAAAKDAVSKLNEQRSRIEDLR